MAERDDPPPHEGQTVAFSDRWRRWSLIKCFTDKRAL